MAYPPEYTRTFSFTDFETTNPDDPKPGDSLDTEFDNVANALTATQTNLALIQRADGQLANDSVGEDQLQEGLLDDLVTGITDDAEAAADAAAASAAAAASSAAAAATSVTDSANSAAASAGSAAAAASSQGLAQGAAIDAEDAAADAEDAADDAQTAANSVVNSVSEAQLHEEKAFQWAEYLAAPVAPAPPGWPEAVDDGMFSAKWWALRARDYNATSDFDFGTAGADIGEAFDIWDAIPGNDLPLGAVYATWGTPPHTFVLTDPSNPSDPDSWTDITGGPGPAGPPNTLTIGTVTSGIPAAATITGTAPNQVLSLTIPPGATGATGPTGPAGATGPAGPANTLNIGTVLTGAPGSSAASTITGSAPNQTLNLTIPRGDTGAAGAPGATGPMGPPGPTLFDDPTVLVDLVMQPGDSTAAMRSDAAPALNQAISPTWTGTHRHNGAVNFTGPFLADSSEGTAGQVLAAQGAGLPAVWRTAAGGTIDLGWNFNTATATANPGSQKLAFNNTTYSTTTALFVNSLAFNNYDASTILSLLVPGNRIYMQARADATKAVVYEVTANPTNNTGWFTVPVTIINQRGTLFLNNADLSVVFILSAAGGVAVANPTATVGLTAVNGVASTAMRSDGAPALSQAINPVWTGVHNWGSAVGQTTAPAIIRARVNAFEFGHSNAGGYASTLGHGRANGRPFLAFHAEHGTNDNTFMTRGIIGRVMTTDGAGTLILGRLPTASADNQALTTDFTINASGNADFAGAVGILGALTMSALTNVITNAGGPLLKYIDTDAAVDEKNWRTRNNNGQYIISTENDAGTEQGQAVNFQRTGSTITVMSFGNATHNPAYNFLGTGTTTVSGKMVIGAATGGAQGVGSINAQALYINGVAVSGPAVAANPTASVGTAAVNGVATTFMRSDAAPAINLAMVPTWTGIHTFTGFNAVQNSGTNPAYVLIDTDEAAGDRAWRFRINAKLIRIEAADDALSSVSIAWAATRGTGSVITSVQYGNATDNPTHNFVGTGTATFGGAVVGSSVSAPSNAGAGIALVLTGGAATATGNGGNATVNGGTATDGNGGTVQLNAANGTGTNRAGGSVTLSAGIATGTATGGQVSLVAGTNNNAGGTGGGIVITAGAAANATGTGGNVTITSGVAAGGGTPGSILLRTGTTAVTNRLFINGDGSWGLGAAATVGTSGQVLTSQGAAPPAWTTPATTPIGANPTGTIGLTAVNGSASTFLRSDGVHALSQAIAPTWSALHTFGVAPALPDGNNTTPGVRFVSETGTGFYRAGAGIVGVANATFTGALLGRGYLNLIGNNSTTANQCYVQFMDSASVSLGYVGDLGSTDNNISLVASGSGANVTITAGASGGIVNMTSAAQAPSFTSTSSRTIKRETGAPRRAANILAKLRPLLYRLLEGDDREQLGLIAEEVHEACPQLSDGKSVAYDRLAILLLAAWQEEHLEAA